MKRFVRRNRSLFNALLTVFVLAGLFPPAALSAPPQSAIEPARPEEMVVPPYLASLASPSSRCQTGPGLPSRAEALADSAFVPADATALPLALSISTAEKPDVTIEGGEVAAQPLALSVAHLAADTPMSLPAEDMATLAATSFGPVMFIENVGQFPSVTTLPIQVAKAQASPPASQVLSDPPPSENDDWNLTGFWRWEAHITAGPNAGETVNGTAQLYQDGTALSGSFTSSKGNGTLTGTYDDNQLIIDYYVPATGYSAQVKASATRDGNRLVGMWDDISGNSGTYVAWGQVPPPPPRAQFFGGDACVGRLPCGMSLDPVNTALGNYVREDVDLQVPSLGLPFAFRRVYNSQDEAIGPLGRGWTHSYDLRLVRDGAVVTVTVESGARHVYRQVTQPPDGTFSYMRPFGVFADLLRGSNAYTLTRAAQITYTFSLSGYLTSIFDAHGNRVGLEYDGDRNLTVITDTVGRTYHLEYDGASQLIALRDPINRVVRYGYDGDFLTVITDTRGVTTTITYDAGGRLETMTRASRPVVANDYDGEGRVIWQRERGLSVYTVTYTTTSSGGMTYTVTTITDPLGRVTTDYHDDHFRRVRRVDGLGNTAPTEFDAYYNPRVITDTNGHATQRGYDSNGNMIYVANLSLPYTTSFTYDSRNNLTSRTDALGRTTTYEYDADNNLIRTTDPLSGTVVYTYTEHGQVRMVTDENGHTTTYGYDEFGQRVAITDTLGHVTRFGYDGVGRLITTTMAAGAPQQRVTVNEYDDGDNLVRVTENYLAGQPPNHLNEYNVVTEYAYDGADNRIQITNPKLQITKYEYDAANRLMRTVENYDPAKAQNEENVYNVVTGYGYDEIGNQVTVTDTLGRVTLSEYDELNRPITVTVNYVDGGPVDAETNVTTVYGYDAAGNRVQITNPKSQNMSTTS